MMLELRGPPAISSSILFTPWFVANEPHGVKMAIVSTRYVRDISVYSVAMKAQQNIEKPSFDGLKNRKNWNEWC